MITDKQYQTALAHFDFDKVQKVYELLNWKWYNSEGPPRIPTKEDLVDCVIDLIDTMKESTEEVTSTGTGGLFVYKEEVESGKWVVNIDFVAHNSVG